MKNYLIIVLCSFFGQMYAQEYIKINRTDINIRMLPTTASPIVGHAFQDEIYIMNGEKPKWYSVLLPSGESRWIYKRLAEKVTSIDSLSKQIDILQVKQELKLASDRAHKDSNEEKINDLNKIEINNILFDRYVLIILQN